MGSVAQAGVGWAGPNWAVGLPARLHDFVKTALIQQLVPPDATMQAHILSPLGFGLKAFTCYPEEEKATCNLGEEVALARDILETYRIVLCIKSPLLVHAPIGNGGIRLGIWLPVQPSAGDLDTEKP